MNQHSAEIYVVAEASFLGAPVGPLYHCNSATASPKAVYKERIRRGPNRLIRDVKRVNVQHTISLFKELRISELDALLLSGVLERLNDGTYALRMGGSVPTFKVYAEHKEGLYKLWEGVCIERLVIPIRPAEALTVELGLRAARYSESYVTQKAGEVVYEPAESLSHLHTTPSVDPLPPGGFTDLNFLLEAPRSVQQGRAVPSGVLGAKVIPTANYTHYVEDFNARVSQGATGDETCSVIVASGGRVLTVSMAGAVFGDDPLKPNGEAVRQVNIEVKRFDLSLTV